MKLKEAKNPIILAVFLLVLGIIFGGLLAGVNALTSPVVEAQKQAKLEAELKAVNVTEPVELKDYSKDSGVNKVYTGKVDGKDVYVVSAEDTNAYTTITVLVVVKDGKVLNASVSGSPTLTTHGMDSQFTLDGLHLIGAEGSNSITAVSGATKSSESIKKCVQAAIDQVKNITGGLE